MPEQEKLLSWNESLQRWEHGNGARLIWITDATLKEYIQAWYVLHKIDRPTARQRADASTYCLRATYYEYILDPAVHVVKSARQGQRP